MFAKVPKGKVSGIAYLTLTFAYLPLTSPLTLPLTLALQKDHKHACIFDFDLRYAQKERPLRRLPVRFFKP